MQRLRQYGVRFRPEEMVEIVRAAKRLGMGMAEFVREACREKVAGIGAAPKKGKH